MSTDRFGTPLALGDVVAAIVPHYSGLGLGRVTKLNRTGVTVEWSQAYSSYLPAKSPRSSDQVVKAPDHVHPASQRPTPAGSAGSEGPGEGPA